MYGSSKCADCAKTAYAAESTKYGKLVFHTSCFKCLNCRSRLSLTGIAEYQGKLFCKTCFKRKFTESGGKYSALDKAAAAASSSSSSQNEPTQPAQQAEQAAPVLPEPTPIASPPTHPHAADKENSQPTQVEEQPISATVFRSPTPEPATTSTAQPTTATSTAQSTTAAATGAGKVTSRFLPVCAACSKVAYAAESTKYSAHIYHTRCFACISCKNRLTLTGVVEYQGQLFCKNCFKRKFSESGGNYSALQKPPVATSTLASTANPTQAVSSKLASTTNPTQAVSSKLASTANPTQAVSSAFASTANPTQAASSALQPISPSKAQSGSRSQPTSPSKAIIQPMSASSSKTSPSKSKTSPSKTAAVATGDENVRLHTAADSPSKSPSKFSLPALHPGRQQPPSQNTCQACGQEASARDSTKHFGTGKNYHKSCFACQTCHILLTLTSVSKSKNKLFCKACYRVSINSTLSPLAQRPATTSA